MIRIAMAYDHQLVLDGLKSMIDQHEGFKFVAGANNGTALRFSFSCARGCRFGRY